jgi:hypothetical protein
MGGIEEKVILKNTPGIFGTIPGVFFGCFLAR